MIGWTFCSGIGAPEMAAPWMDWRLASEIEKFPREVLRQRLGYKLPDEHNQGDPLLWGDMTEVNADLARSRGVPLPDIIVAGTPCQAFSVAGLRKGTEDPRGNLTLAFVEIVHDIVAARPDGKLAVLWENVPGVLSDKGNAFGAFLGGLVGALDALPKPAGGSWPGEGMVEGPRARAAWAVLDAQWFGVAQRRRRVFVVVDFGNCVDPAAVLLEPDRLRGNSPPRREAGQVAPTIPIRSSAGGGLGTDFDCDGGLIHSASEVTHSLRGEGFDASEDGTRRGTPIVPVAFGTGGHFGGATQQDISDPLRAKGGDAGNGGETLIASARRDAFAIQERAVCENPNAGLDGAGFRQDGTAYTLEARSVPQAVCFSSKDYGADAEVDLSPTLRAGGHSESHANAGVPPAVAFDLRGRDGGAMPEGPHDTANLRAASGGSSRSYVAQPWAVRRLTPTECARLQGFHDDHTRIEWRGKPADQCPDGPQYKAYGNSMAVPVVRYILDRMRRSMESVA